MLTLKLALASYHKIYFHRHFHHFVYCNEKDIYGNNYASVILLNILYQHISPIMCLQIFEKLTDQNGPQLKIEPCKKTEWTYCTICWPYVKALWILSLPLFTSSKCGLSIRMRRLAGSLLNLHELQIVIVMLVAFGGSANFVSNNAGCSRFFWWKQQKFNFLLLSLGQLCFLIFSCQLVLRKRENKLEVRRDSLQLD